MYLHGLSCDMTVRRTDEHTLLATDCLQYLARAFRFRGAELQKGGPTPANGFQSGCGNGYVWLQGLPRGGRHGRFPDNSEDFRNG